MDKMAILGGHRLQGQVAVSGAKNSALPVIFSTLLAEGKFALHNIPNLQDIKSTRQLMESLGCSTEYSNRTLQVVVPAQTKTLAHYDLVRKMRASILALGPLLARYGQAVVSLPGGCAIGARPINFHLQALQQMGAQLDIEGGYIVARTDKLKGAVIEFPFPSVGGTENIMMAACLADGETTIKNAACEPEIVDHGDLLIKMGAKIRGHGTPTIVVEGVDSLSPCEHTIIADRIEAGTLVIAGAITGGEITLTNCRPDHLTSLLDKLEQAGVGISTSENTITMLANSPLKPIDVETEPYPGFPTDLQAQYMTLMTQADGESKIIESVFENRFMHVGELARMNAKIAIDGKTAKVTGQPGTLYGAPVMATDLRASASLVLAGLCAKGETVVSRIYHLDRGYERLEEKLSSLGGRVRRLKE